MLIVERDYKRVNDSSEFFQATVVSFTSLIICYCFFFSRHLFEEQTVPAVYHREVEHFTSFTDDERSCNGVRVRSWLVGA